MALISNAKFALRASDIAKATKLLRSNPDFFEKKNQSEAMLEMVRGSAYVPAVKGWMQSALLLEQTRPPSLSKYALEILDKDPDFSNSNTWWAIHLLLCFSDLSSPYREFFLCFDSSTGGWLPQQDHQKKVVELAINNAEVELGKMPATASVETSYNGVVASFNIEPDRPLANLGLVEKMSMGGANYRKAARCDVSDATFVFALSLAKLKHFRVNASIDFTQLYEIGLHQFLGCSRSQLVEKATSISNNPYWGDYFTYDNALNLDSITFKDSCVPLKVLPLMLQEKVQGWL